MYHILLAIIFLICASFKVYSTAEIDCHKHRCLTVVNAGSTGSRVYIYAYDLDSTKTPTNIKLIWSNSIKPGLANLKPEASTIFPYLNKLFNNFPTEDLQTYFYSTAGMRLIAQKDSDLTYKIVRSWFKKKQNLHLVDSRTIAGEEEGIFDWLAINYQLQRFKPSNQQLVAVVDIGGASSQIAFPLPKDLAINHNKNMYTLTLYGNNFKIASYSFLGLGANKVLDQFKNYLPCSTKGFPVNPEVKGKGDMPQCIQSISKTINTYPLKEIKKQVSLYSPKEWYLIGGISQMLNEYHLSDKDSFTNKEMAIKSEKLLCDTNWLILKKQYKAKEIDRDCASSSYLYSLLVNGYGIPSNEKISVMPAETNNDWSLGVVFVHPN